MDDVTGIPDPRFPAREALRLHALACRTCGELVWGKGGSWCERAAPLIEAELAEHIEAEHPVICLQPAAHGVS